MRGPWPTLSPETLKAVVAAAKRGAFVIPTLTVIESFMGAPGGESLASDARFAPFLLDEQVATLRSMAPKGRKYGPHESFKVARETSWAYGSRASPSTGRAIGRKSE